MEQRYNIELTEAELAATANGTQWLWVYGVLGYRDPCHTEHEHNFCWRFENFEPQDEFYYFTVANPPSYMRSF